MSDIQEDQLAAAQKRGNVAIELIAGSVGGACQVLVGQVRKAVLPTLQSSTDIEFLSPWIH
jgi:hypothetical protein